MLYRLLCNFNDNIGLVVFLVYLAAFLLAFILVFIFPIGALALVFLGLMGLVGVWILTASTRAFERSIGRRALATARCPVCDGDTSPPSERGGLEHVACLQCEQAFELDGRRFELDEDEDDQERPEV